jgi:glutathione S-transferase
MCKRSSGCWRSWDSPTPARTTAGNSTTRRPRSILKLNPSGKVPTLVDGEVVRVGIEHDSALPVAASRRRRGALSRRPRGAQPGRALDGLAARLVQCTLPRLSSGKRKRKKRSGRRASAPTSRSSRRNSSCSRRARPAAPGSPGANFSIADICLGPSSIVPWLFRSRCRRFRASERGARRSRPELPTARPKQSRALAVAG